MWILWAKGLLPNSGLLAVEESPWGVKNNNHAHIFGGGGSWNNCAANLTNK